MANLTNDIRQMVPKIAEVFERLSAELIAPMVSARDDSISPSPASSPSSNVDVADSRYVGMKQKSKKRRKSLYVQCLKKNVNRKNFL